MTDTDLDALLASAKPAKWNEDCWGWIPGVYVYLGGIPDEVRCFLNGAVRPWDAGAPPYFYPTEAAAMDALRAAIQAYKESRQ